MIDDDVNVTFTRPVIAPKVYITKGPSGWPESFKREVADKELTRFIVPCQIKDLVQIFIGTRDTTEKKVTDWYTIVGFIARTMGCTPRSVPHIAGVAFWAHVLQEQLTRDVN